MDDGVKAAAGDTAITEKGLTETARTGAEAVGSASRGGTTIGSAPAGTAGASAQPSGAAQKVRVRPLRTYLDGETKQHVRAGGEAYEVTRGHAVELRQNGLVEFESESDEHDAIAERVRAEAARHATRTEEQGIPENSRGKPLRNPKLNLPTHEEVAEAASRELKKK